MKKALEILIVEDDEVDRMIIKRAIKSSGLNIDVSFAEDAESGLKATTGRCFDCIFLDYNLPGGTGLDLMKKIKSEGNASPIIIVTSHGDENIAVEAMKNGAIDYIPKSLMSGEGLTQSLRMVVKLKNAELEKEKVERALLETEHRLHAIVANTPIVLFALDDKGVFTLFEGKGVEELGLDKSRIIGKTIHSFIYLLPQIEGIFERAIAGENVTAILELGPKFYQAYYTPILDRFTQKVTGVIGVSYDITGHKKAEEELMNAKQVAEEAAKLKEQFLANMSHEIRTPMNGIIGLSRILAGTVLNKEQERYLNSIITSSDNLMVIINDILDLSKIEAGKMSFESTPFRMEEVIQHSMELFEPKASERNLEFRTDIDPGIPSALSGDPVRLGQILNNLVGNAIKFTNRGHVIVSARMRSNRENSVTIDFSVRDTGIGIPERSLATIFESFTQASSDTSRKFGGTGLGLTIVKRLVELQGGSIRVESREGEGTQFSFHITFKKCRQADMRPSETRVNIQKDITHLRLLVAEDNLINRMIVEKIFRDWEVPVDFAENGKQALAMLQQKHYDLVLMDIQMPEMDGYEACKHIRQDPDKTISSIPVIALTAHAMTSEKEKCMSFGMDDYLCKPFDPKILRAKIIRFTAQASCEVKPRETAEVPAPVKPALPETAAVLKEMGEKIDLTYLREISDNNDEFIIQMIELFLQKTPGAIVDMNTSFKEQNWKELRMIAHRIKPSFNYVGASVIQKKLALIENYSESQSNLDKIEGLIQEVESSSKSVFSELETELKNMK
jgi:PAS domain S-box-containing protein